MSANPVGCEPLEGKTLSFSYLNSKHPAGDDTKFIQLNLIELNWVELNRHSFIPWQSVKLKK